MSKTNPIPFIGLRLHRNRNSTGRRSSLPAKRAALYIAYGPRREARLEAQLRGEWHGPGGRVYPHEEVTAWARQAALAHRYTCEAVLSVQQAELTAADFCRALEEGGDIGSYRLMAHHDTDYHHAHVLFFRDQRLPKQAFIQWQTVVRQELARQEEMQLAGRGRQQQAEAAAEDDGRARALQAEAELGSSKGLYRGAEVEIG